MKKSLVFAGVFALLVLLAVQGVYAISSDLRGAYRPGETMIAELQGNFLSPIEKENVEFYRGHVLVPFEYDIMKLGDRYFLWAVAQENENNYTLKIKDISTTINGKPGKIDFEKNFSIIGNLIDYSIKPGVIFANSDFEITIQLNEDLNKEINVNFPEERSVLLKPGENKIEFSIGNVEGTQFLIIGVGQYAVPTYIIGKKKSMVEVNLPEIRFNPRFIESKILITDNSPIYPFEMINSGDRVVHVQLDYDRDLFLIGEDEFDIDADKIAYLNLSLKTKPTQGINKTITANYGNLSLEMPIFVEFTEDITEAYTPYLNDSFTENSLWYCSELKGKQCTAGETCNGNISASRDGSCCVGTCQAPSKKSYAWIGWLIAGIVIIGGLYVWAKYKKAKGDRNPLQTKIRNAENI